MMTRQDFEAIAATVRRVRRCHGKEQQFAMEHIATALADMCAETNPRFDRRLFLQACREEQPDKKQAALL